MFNYIYNVKYARILFKSNMRMRSSTNTSTHCQILMDTFGFTYKEAEKLEYSQKLHSIRTHSLIDMLNFLKSWGFTKEQVLSHSRILPKHPHQIEQNYMLLEEGGFHDITPQLLLKTRSYIHKSVHNLKTLKLIKPEVNVVDCFIEYMKPLPKNFEVPKFNDNYNWRHIQNSLVQSYLLHRLNTTEEVISRLCRIHRNVLIRCFRVIRENIRLAEELGYSSERIIRNGYILHSYPKYTQAALRDFANIAGGDLRAAMKQYPKLIMISPERYSEILGILKDFEISDEAIRRNMHIFILSPKTLRLRLQYISETPDFKVTLRNPNILRLVISHHRAKSRLNHLQQMKLKCASCLTLGSNAKNNFENHINEGKDINNFSDVMNFLQNLFKTDVLNLKEMWKRHPFAFQIPITEIDRTYTFLIQHNYKQSDIMTALHILLYSVEKIELALLGLKENESLFHSISNIQKLNLILYYMEKDHHFTGNGVWGESGYPEMTENSYE